MFDASVIGKKYLGAGKAVYKSIMDTDIDLRREFYSNIILSGGTTLLPGISERIYREVTDRCSISKRVKVIAQPERKFSAWIGG